MNEIEHLTLLISFMFIFLGHLALQVKFFKKKKVCSGETLEITLVDSLTVWAELLKCLSIFLCSFQNSYKYILQKVNGEVLF